MRLDHHDPPQHGEAVQRRGVCVVPLFHRLSPGAAYVTLAEALPLGLTITEVDDAGRVGRLRVDNPTGSRVLLYDGQELLGAKQNRIPDVTVLIEAGVAQDVPVSCVEAGRWRHVGRTFAAADHTSHPELRRRKAERLHERGIAPGAAQHEVWAAVAQKSARLGVHSPTGAQAQVFSERAPDIDRLARRFPLQPGQCGAVLALGGRPVCLDLLSRPDAFARLYQTILRGYLMDAIESLGGPATDPSAVEAFTAAVVAAPTRRSPSAGLGDDVRLAADGLIGSGLALDGEVLQLSAYAGAAAT